MSNNINKEFKCPDCEKICKTSAALKSHIKSHSDMYKKSDELQKVIKEQQNKTNKVELTLEESRKEIENLKQQLEQIKLENKEYKDKLQIVSKTIKDCNEILHKCSNIF